MPSTLYDQARAAFANGDISWTRDTIRAVALDLGAYTPDFAAHQFLADVPVGARYGTPLTLSAKTCAAGVCDAADGTIDSITAAPTLEGVLLYQDTGAAATSRLIGVCSAATGLPTAAGVTQMNIAWDNGPNRIFKL